MLRVSLHLKPPGRSKGSDHSRNVSNIKMCPHLYTANNAFASTFRFRDFNYFVLNAFSLVRSVLVIAKVGDLCCKWLVNQPRVVRHFCKSSRQGVSPSHFLEMKHFVPALCCCHSVRYCFRFCMKASPGVFCVLYKRRLPILCLQKWWSLYIECPLLLITTKDRVYRWAPGSSSWS